MKNQSLAKPLVHLNGTSRAELVRQYETAMNALNTAIDLVRETAPHGRDYYPLPPAVGGIAVQQHNDRMNRLCLVHNELSEIFDHITEVGR